ncbi:hypothetical protein [Micromonospora sp. NPDC023814]|uniref:hypothetical protein n=1 Tax=Micromonospora sp. NPDC023814 TaxID=3154596 RepID=UPI00340B0F8A
MAITTEAPAGGVRGPWRRHWRAGGEQPRRIPGLFDLAVVVAPDGGLATRQRPDRSLTGAQLADMVRENGGDGFDVRLLVATGPQTRATIQAMAHELGRDVLVAPAGSELTYIRSMSELSLTSARRSGTDGGGGGDCDVVPVDLFTGHPVNWLVVQPSGDQGSGQSWFELVGGLVREREGTAALPLPGGGLSLATREDFVERRSAAATMRPGHPSVLTVAVGVRAGDFVVGDYNGRVSLRDGRQLAAALAPLPLYGWHLRLWLSWPETAEERRRLGLNLARLAETTGATVWAPAEGDQVEILEGCRDLSVIRRDARPGRWERYGDSTGEALFQTDVDGRLVPVGGLVTTSYPGVPLVSVPAAHEQSQLAIYERLRPSQAIFRADLAVLADGRLALRYRDDSLLAAGERQTSQLLEAAGWRGTDLLLLSAISPERAAGARHHADRLGRYLRCGITLSEASDPRSQPAPAELTPPEPEPYPLAAPPATRAVPVEAPRMSVVHAVPEPAAAVRPVPTPTPEPATAPRPAALPRPEAVRGPAALPRPEAVRGPAARPWPAASAEPTPEPTPATQRTPEALPVTADSARPAAGTSKSTGHDSAVPAKIGKNALPPYPASTVASTFTELGPGEAGQTARSAALHSAVAGHTATARALPIDGSRRTEVAGAHAVDTPLVSEIAAPSVDGPERAATTGPEAPGPDADPPPDRFTVPLPAPASRLIDGPRLTEAQRSPTWHGLTWLKPQPQVNEDECELFVECAVDPDVAVTDGVPSPGLFLLAHLDAVGLGARTRARHLLTLRVGPGGAVDVAASDAEPPPALAPALRDRDVYLLPAGWLDRCRIVAALKVGSHGDLTPHRRWTDAPVRLLSRGAAHGVPGLPDEVQRWPRGRLQTAAARFIMVRADSPEGLGQWQRLHRQRPPVLPDHRLIEVLVDRDRAIDVAGTARALAGLTRVRTILPRLMTDGNEYILPVASYPYVRVEREYVAERRRWRRIRSSAIRTLDAWRPEPA